MNYTHYDLGGLGKGRTVEVVLQGNAANVYLMDHENMAKYAKAKPFYALGGLMTFSPIRMQTISSAHWHVVIDMPKGRGQVKTAYRLLNFQQPNISTTLTKFTPTEEQKRAVAIAEKPAASTSAASTEAAAEQAAPKEKQRITCPKCKILTAHGKFCTECGEPMKRICPGCYIVASLECKYCAECGTKLAEEM
ncbi:MAG: DUF1883 domain-containing protein [Defluviitaleaceae bacterium]|nr:DUF1883 domain-containing protein [Defluviitaleaceae bacterium]